MSAALRAADHLNLLLEGKLGQHGAGFGFNGGRVGHGRLGCGANGGGQGAGEQNGQQR